MPKSFRQVADNRPNKATPEELDERCKAMVKRLRAHGEPIFSGQIINDCLAAADLIESLVQKKGDTSVPQDKPCESPPETEGSWGMRCASLYQVIGALSYYSGTFGTDDIDNALDVACGRGDVDALIPWPKDIARFDALEKLTTGI